MPTQKHCAKCHQDKPLDDFGPATKRPDGKQHWCRTCIRLQGRIGARHKRERLREQIFDKLGRKCVCCGFIDKRALQIDHVNGNGLADHIATHRGIRFLQKVLADQTGAFQILCANCNWIKRAELNELPQRLPHGTDTQHDHSNGPKHRGNAGY